MFFPKINVQKYPILNKCFLDFAELLLSNNSAMDEVEQLLKDYPIINSSLPKEVKKIIKERKI